MKRKLIAWGAALAVLASAVGVVLFLPDGAGVDYGIKSGTIAFSAGNNDITGSVIGSTGYEAASNGNFTLLLDGKANPIIRSQATGRVWRAAPSGTAGTESKFSSALDIAYYYENARTLLYSSDSSVAKNQVRVFKVDGGVRVEYIFGEMEEDFVYPEQISEERMKQFMAKMSKDDANYINRRYTLYSVELAEGANRDYLLNQYPRLAKENLYVLTDISNQSMKKRTDGIFRSADYTEVDRDQDNSGSVSERENPKSFKISVEYRLTDTGFKASVDLSQAEFYQDYPITEIDLLPNFSGFEAGESGYYMLPAGSGALIDVDGTAAEKSYSLPVYGQNSSVTRKLDSSESVCTLPVYGQYKNGGGWLCILDQGACQATLQYERTVSYTRAYPAFTVIDNGIYSMQSKTDTTLFASRTAAESFSAEYVLMCEAASDTAYSQMAQIYRDRLSEEGFLNKTVSGSSPKLLAEMVGAIKYDTLAAGLIPSSEEFAMTSFEDMSAISDDLEKITGSENLMLMISGWSKNGLNAQNPGSAAVSGAAGGKNKLKQLLQKLDKAGVPYFVNLEFTTVDPKKLLGYSAASNSARALNNSVALISFLDPVNCSWQEDGTQLISPAKYKKLWNSYQKGIDYASGLGVSQLAGRLYGDYANGSSLTRGESVEIINSVLSGIQSTGSRVIGNAGNLYALPYLSYIDHLSVSSTREYVFSRDIPFVQLVLHGAISYCSENMNGSTDSTESLLHLIETGSDLRYTITAESPEKLYETDFSTLYNTGYSSVKDKIASNYAVLKTALDGLADCRMVSHRYLADDVVLTEYENGTCIYVNYGDTAFSEGGVTVEAKSYLRVNG